MLLHSNDILFIKEEKWAIINIKEKEQVINFIRDIIAMFEDNNKQPFAMTEKTKEQIKEYLLKVGGEKKPDVNKLIAFFTRMKVGEYIYIRTSRSKMFADEQLSSMQRALHYYNQGMREDEIKVKMQEVLLEQRKITNIQQEVEKDYEIIYHNGKGRTYFGEAIKNKRLCIYCGKGEKDGVKFNEIAHAIPEGIGNKTLIQYEECDECNDFFSRNVEEDICTFLNFERLRFGITGKNGKPTIELDNTQCARYFDLNELDIEKDYKRFNGIKKLDESEKEFKGMVIIDTENRIKDGQIEIQDRRSYIPRHVYKTLCKIVIGTIEKQYLPYFKNTIKWLRYEDESQEKLRRLPLMGMMILPDEHCVTQPEVTIHIRKNNNMDLPYCYGVIRTMNICFVVIIPFCTEDSKVFNDAKEYKEFWKKQILYRDYDFDFVDFSDMTPIKRMIIGKEKRKLNVAPPKVE